MTKRPDRQVRPFKDIGAGLFAALADRQVRLRLGLTISVIFGAAVFYRLVEGWRWIDAFYFSTVTIATVGYGDFAPTTDAGKLFTMAYLVVGVGLFVATAAALAEHVMDRARERRLQARRTGGTASDTGDDPDGP